MRAENKVHEMGKNSQAVRAKLIDRTPKSGEMALRGHPSLAMEVVQTVDMPHQLYIDKAEGPYLTLCKARLKTCKRIRNMVMW